MAALLSLELVLTNLFLLFQVLLFVGLANGGTEERSRRKKEIRQNIATIENFEIFKFYSNIFWSYLHECWFGCKGEGLKAANDKPG